MLVVLRSAPSKELNGEYRAELRNKKTMLSKVQTDHRHILLTLDGARAAIDNLKWNREQLAAQVPDGGSSSVGEDERLQLAGSLRELGELIIAREALIDELTSMAEKVDVKGALVRAGGVAHKEEVFSHESQAIDAKRAEVQASIAAQGELMARIKRENDLFNAAKSSDGANNEREKRLRNLSDAVNAFETIMSDIKHATLTLNELERKVETFKNDVSGYIVAREMAREEQMMVRRLAFSLRVDRRAPLLCRPSSHSHHACYRTSAVQLAAVALVQAADVRATRTPPRTRSSRASCSKRWKRRRRSAAATHLRLHHAPAHLPPRPRPLRLPLRLRLLPQVVTRRHRTVRGRRRMARSHRPTARSHRHTARSHRHTARQRQADTTSRRRRTTNHPPAAITRRRQATRRRPRTTALLLPRTANRLPPTVGHLPPTASHPRRTASRVGTARHPQRLPVGMPPRPRLRHPPARRRLATLHRLCRRTRRFLLLRTTAPGTALRLGTHPLPRRRRRTATANPPHRATHSRRTLPRRWVVSTVRLVRLVRLRRPATSEQGLGSGLATRGCVRVHMSVRSSIQIHTNKQLFVSFLPWWCLPQAQPIDVANQTAYVARSQGPHRRRLVLVLVFASRCSRCVGGRAWQHRNRRTLQVVVRTTMRPHLP